MSFINKIQEGQNTIGNRKYLILKSYDFDNMTVDDILKFKEERKMTVSEALLEIKKYEDKFRLTDDQKEKQKEYFKNILNPKTKKLKKVTAEYLYKLFVKKYRSIYKVDYNVTKGSESLENLKTLLFYFTKDDRFFKQANVIESLMFGHVKKTSKPSFSKGFILIGDYGVGKTSSMHVFKLIFDYLKKNGFDVPAFRSYTTQFLSESFENCEKPKDKKNFWELIKKGRIFFDDLKAESNASNFGVKNIMQETLQKREYMIDYVSINFKKNHPNNINEALLEIGENYGGRVFDRIFSKWNIIHFKGRSNRGKN